MISQTEALQNLVAEREQVANALKQLQTQISQGQERYLKLQGAIEVLEQLTGEESKEEVETPVAETEVVEGEE